MGVHTTFVRSVDLDEWTLRQIDAMRLGGNANAREYFRKHGLTDMNTKIEKKYQSKAAQSYRKVLGDWIDAEALKRGEGMESTTTSNISNSNSSSNPLMDSLHAADAQEAAAMAKAAAAGVSNTNAPPVAVAKAVQASQLHAGKGKLLTPPSSGNAPKLVLRKPASGSSLGMLKKKPTAAGRKVTGLRVSSSSTTTTTNTNANDGNSSDDGMEDIDKTMRLAKADKEEAAKAVEAQKEATSPAALAAAAQQEEAARKLALQLEQQTHIAAATAAAKQSPSATKPAPTQTMADSLAKMKAGNSDFFAGL